MFFQGVLVASIALQLAAALLAIRLSLSYGKQRSWLLIAGALVLMTLRRLTVLIHAANWLDTLLLSEWIGLVISALMLGAMVSIGPLLLGMARARQLGATAQAELADVSRALRGQITEHRQVQTRLARLNECFLSFSADSDENIQRLTMLCGELMNASCALYNRLEAGLLCSRGQWQTPADYDATDQPDGHICYDVIQYAGSEPYVVRDLLHSKYAQTDPNVRQYGLQTYMGQAVRLDEHSVGSLCVVYQHDVDPGDDDRRWMSILASALSVEEHRKQVQARLSLQAEMLDSVHEAVVTVDRDLIVTYWNKGAEEFFGYSRDETEHQPVLKAVGENADRARAFLQKAFERKYWHGEYSFLHADGSTKWLDVSLGVMTDKVSGEPVSIIGVGRDITARKQAEQELQNAYQSLEQRVKERTADLHTANEQLTQEITDRKQAQAAMQRERDFAHSLVETAPVIVLVLDCEGRIVQYNPYLEELSGYPLATKRGQDWCDAFLPARNRARTRETLARLLSGERQSGGLNVIVDRDGREHDIEWFDTVLTAPDGSPAGILSIGRDVSLRLQAQQALASSEARYRHLFEDSPVALLEEDLSTLKQHLDDLRQSGVSDFRAYFDEHPEAGLFCAGLVHIVDANRAALDLFRVKDKTDLVGQDMGYLLGGEALSVFNEDLVYAANGITYFSNEMTVTLPGGEKINVIVTFNVPSDHEDTWNECLVSFSDITERKRAEAALRESESRFRQITETIREVFWMVSFEGKMLYVSSAFEEIWGRPCASVYENPQIWMNAIHPEDQERMLVASRRLRQGVPVMEEYRIIRPDGSIRWVQDRAFPVIEEHDEPYRIVGVVEDITERRHIREALRESEERLRMLIENAEDIIVLLDTDCRYLYYNGPQRYGLTARDMLGKTPFDLYPPDEAHRLVEQLESVADSGQALMVENYVTWQGETLCFSDHIYAVRDMDGTVTAVGKISRNITEHKRAEQRELELLLERERTHILTRFVQDASHEFGNPLSVIKSGMYLLERVDDPNRRQQHLEMLNRQVGHIEALIEGMVTMFRLDNNAEFEFTAVDINYLVQLMLDDTSLEWQRKRQTIHRDLEQGVPPIKADQKHLYRAICNLFDNALLYTPEGGTIRLRTESLDDWIVLEVSDTGVGIEPAELEHIFEQFYRIDSARTERGAGMGLPIAQRIVEVHGGRIEVQSTPGQGSTFRILLPK